MSTTPLIRTILRSPGAAVILGITLWILAACQPWTTFIGGFMSGGGTHCFFPRMCGVSRTTGGTITLTGPDDDAPVQVSAFSRATRSGFWAPTSLTINSNLTFSDYEFESTLTPVERTQIRLQYADHLASLGFQPDVISAIRAGEAVTTTPIWSGYGIDAAILLLAAALAYSLSWAPAHLRVLFANNRRAAAALAGLCPACSYDLRGLPPGSPCPECGARPEPCGICGYDLAEVPQSAPCPQCNMHR